MTKSKKSDDSANIKIDIQGKIPDCKVFEKTHTSKGVYCIGAIGAAIYFISNATGFWNGALGLLKAMVWPAFVVHGLLGLLGL